MHCFVCSDENNWVVGIGNSIVHFVEQFTLRGEENGTEVILHNYLRPIFSPIFSPVGKESHWLAQWKFGLFATQLPEARRLEMDPAGLPCGGFRFLTT